MATAKKPTKQDNETKAAFEVTSPLHHDGDRYEIGDTVMLTESQAEELVAAGAVKVAAEAKQ